MSLEKAKSTATAIGLFLFISGLFLMIIAEHVDFVFGVGLILLYKHCNGHDFSNLEFCRNS